MKLIELHVHVHNHSECDNDILKQINNKIQLIMGAIENLNAKIAELQEQVDAEQVQINELLEGQKTTIAALEEQVTTLEAQVAAGATSEQVAASIESINTIISDIKSTVPPTS